MEKTVSKYLQHLNIPISSSYVEKLVLSHPDYPSLLSVSDTLQQLGINHKAVGIPGERLKELEFPYLFKSENGKEGLKLIRNSKDLASFDQSEENNIQNIVLQAEYVETVVDEENNKQYSEDFFYHIILGILVVAIAVLILLSAIQLFSWIYTLLLVTAVAGSVAGYLLIAKDVGITYELIESFCNKGKKTNCDAVLESDAAVIFGKVTLSDAVVTYFIFQLLVFSIPVQFGEASSFLGVLMALSIFTIPVIGYSLYYQFMRVKTWCRLCLAIDGVLAIQAVLFGTMYLKNIIELNSITPLVITNLVFLFIAIGSAYLLIKNKMQQAKKAIENEVMANRIKYSSSVFMYLLTQQEEVELDLSNEELRIGKPDTSINILLAGSLDCGPCKVGFEKATKLVEQYPELVNLVIRFSEGGTNNGQITPGKYLLYYWQNKIYERQDDESVHVRRLLQGWYELMDLELFKREYPITFNGDNSGRVRELVGNWGKWFKQVEINKTPTFFINGRKLPKGYQINDLMGLIPGIVEDFSQKGVAEDMRENNHAAHK